MKGYVYISGDGADPGRHGNMNDPWFGRTPTLGACMPNIRRFVGRGDYVFVVSGKTEGVQQYVVGGFRVEEKISALTAYERFPENRLHLDANGVRRGNVIVTPGGLQHPLDRHDPATFERRIENFLVGSNPVVLETPAQIDRGRTETLGKLSEILGKPRANRVIDVMGRWSKLDERQIANMLDWLGGIRSATA